MHQLKLICYVFALIYVVQQSSSENLQTKLRLDILAHTL